MDLEFISTNVGGGKSNILNPERAIVRPEFMELLVRIGIFKFFKSKYTSFNNTTGKTVPT